MNCWGCFELKVTQRKKKQKGRWEPIERFVKAHNMAKSGHNFAHCEEREKRSRTSSQVFAQKTETEIGCFPFQGVHNVTQGDRVSFGAIRPFVLSLSLRKFSCFGRQVKTSGQKGWVQQKSRRVNSDASSAKLLLVCGNNLQYHTPSSRLGKVVSGLGGPWVTNLPTNTKEKKKEREKVKRKEELANASHCAFSKKKKKKKMESTIFKIILETEISLKTHSTIVLKCEDLHSDVQALFVWLNKITQFPDPTEAPKAEPERKPNQVRAFCIVCVRACVCWTDWSRGGYLEHTSCQNF